MEIADLLLKKEELPVLGKWAVVYPIYPGALDARISEQAALAQFKPAFDEWHDDLQKLVENPEIENREWIKKAFLHRRAKKPSTYGFNPYVGISNGFPRELNVSPTICACIGYMKDSIPHVTMLNEYDPLLLFSPEKKRAYSLPDWDYNDTVAIPTYGPHNVDSVATALLLRNWHVRVMNELISSL